MKASCPDLIRASIPMARLQSEAAGMDCRVKPGNDPGSPHPTLCPQGRGGMAAALMAALAPFMLKPFTWAPTISAGTGRAPITTAI